MSYFEAILKEADALLLDTIRKELRAQGHYNTGGLEQSLTGAVSGDRLQGFAKHYSKILHHGVNPQKASMKQFPFLVEYFLSKGYEDKQARTYAAMTINAWKREGMPTLSSARFSQTGQRKNFIEIVNEAIQTELNKKITQGVDKVINNEFHKTKSEKI